VVRNFDVQLGQWFEGNSGATVGCTAWRLAERELCRNSWIYSRPSGCEGPA